jgi:hypothetical protein
MIGKVLSKVGFGRVTIHPRPPHPSNKANKPTNQKPKGDKNRKIETQKEKP